jgi:hypothetical protein
MLMVKALKKLDLDGFRIFLAYYPGIDDECIPA